MSDKKKISAKFWDRRYRDLTERPVAKKRTNWRDIAPVLSYINYRKSGDPRKTFLHYLADKYHFTSGISLGCGDGRYEASICDLNLCKKIVGIDASSEAIALASDKFRNKNLRFIRGDISDVSIFTSEPFDLVVFKDSLHHVLDVENVFELIVNNIEPGGMVIVEDFFGPTRWQWSKKHLNLINKISSILPAKYLMTDAGVRRVVRRHDPYKLAEDDPSESVRSGELLYLIRQYFDVVEDSGKLGTIIFPLFNKISGNFDEENEDHMAIVNLILILEEQLIDGGVLDPVFRSMLVRPKR